MTPNERAFFLLAGFEPFQTSKYLFSHLLKGSLQTVEMKKVNKAP